jgi:hypothetical protein
MSPEQMQKFRNALTAGKVRPEKVSTEYAFQRAWNEGIEFAERQLHKILAEQKGSGCEGIEMPPWA